MRGRNALAIALMLILFLTATAFAQGDFESALRFEGTQDGGTPRGWGGGPTDTLHFDTITVHGGDGAARLERGAASSGGFSTLTKGLPIDFGGKTLELRGFLRTENVSGYAGLWLREDGPGGTVELDNMQDRGVRGTTGWTEYSIRLPLNEDARELAFGVLIEGEGKVWADDLQLLVDGKPLTEAPARVFEQTVLDTDKEFDTGSSVTLSALTETQAENVAVLGRVWGFLKYHHPRVAAGELHWDYELFRVLPAVLEAPDADARNRVLSAWVDDLGVPGRCQPCVKLPEDVALLPPLKWLEDTDLLGPTLSEQLQDVYANRFSGASQFYVSLAPNIGNPVFEHELPYPGQPDAGFRILSLLRLWNIIEYWFPYRDLVEDDWPATLREFLPRFVAADSPEAYRLELLAFITRIGDAHANLWSDLSARPPRGGCSLPVTVRFVEGRAAVTALAGETPGQVGLELGDIISAVDGEPVTSLVQAWSPYYSASNEATRLRDIARALPRGDCGESTLTVERPGGPQVVKLIRVQGEGQGPPTHDRPGETFQLLSDEPLAEPSPPDSVAYLKLSSIREQDVVRYLRQASDTQGLVIDLRNYPSDYVVYTLGSRLVREPTPFVRFTVGDIDNPGAFAWTPPLVLRPKNPAYTGKVAILVDETSQSQAEYTAMALRAGPQAVVVGSTTAGADGDVSRLPLPGGLWTMISGIGVFYPEKTPTQRVGIIPDLFVARTLEGVRGERDEVLEAALRYILPEADEAVIRRTARAP